MSYQTDQESFWAGEFGDEYIERNRGAELLSHNLSMFAKVFARTDRPTSVIEFGANVGLNLKAIHQLAPKAELSAVEINAKAASELRNMPGIQHVYEASILDYVVNYQRDLAFTKGLLIHIDPQKLGTAYDRLYEASSRYVLIAEYYSQSPVEMSYRGHKDRLFKRDFASEMLDRFPALELIDYGFAYRCDRSCPGQDEMNWFLMEKRP